MMRAMISDGQFASVVPASLASRRPRFKFSPAIAACGCALLMLVTVTGCGKPNPADDAGGADTKQASAGGASASDEIDLTLVPGRIHVVRPRETLWSLSEMYYGSNRQWRKILVANRRRVTDPTNLPVGMKLIIP